jgi:hypothetical protein
MTWIRLHREMWTYCQHCMDRQDFEYLDGVWLCKQCGNPLVR